MNVAWYGGKARVVKESNVVQKVAYFSPLYDLVEVEDVKQATKVPAPLL